MKVNTIYSEYDFFAPIYNKHWADFYKYLYPMLKDEILIFLSKDDKILDLCCGTGQLVNCLTQDGFKVIGLDGSKKMLEFARANNNKDVEFIHADIRDFTLKDQFMLVTCIYDSLNHLMCLQDLEKTLANVFDSLKSGGIFVFDMNMEETFVNYWNRCFSIEDEDYYMDVESKYSTVNKVGEMRFTIFTKDKSNIIDQKVIKEKCYKRDEIIGVLSKVGFVDYSERVDGTGRIIFTVRKK